MKRLMLLLMLLLPLTACTPNQVTAWLRWHGEHPTEAQAWLADHIAKNGPIVVVDYGVCGEWHDLAIAAGFTEAQWPTVNRIMYRESRCTPTAYNPSGASGLMQIMPMWADDCGGWPALLFDPVFHLSCAVHILNVQGWSAWAL